MISSRVIAELAGISIRICRDKPETNLKPKNTNEGVILVYTYKQTILIYTCGFFI